MSDDPTLTNVDDISRASQFYDSVTGKWYRRTTAIGTFSFSGLSEDYVITTQQVTSVESKIPATPLADRNTIIIHNTDSANTVYIGKTGVTADRSIGTTAGWELSPDSYFSIDISSGTGVDLYAICPAGQTAVLKIFEAK